MSERVAVLGAGSWGTTLANLLAKKGCEVALWSYEADVADAVNATRENPRYLPGFRLAPGVRATTGIADAVGGAGVVVLVSPAQHLREVAGQAVRDLRPGVLLVSAAKGIEVGTLNTMAQVLGEVLPVGLADTCYLSGPSFAREVAGELATAVTVASGEPAAAARAQRLFQTPYLRVYTSDDVTGVELGGSIKNVMAIGAGMAVGLGLGHNATAALITRGLAEIMRLGVALGAQPLTLSGLAGMGDLILTCTGELSRNRHVGIELGRGRKLEDVLAEMTMVAEGVDTTRSTHALARRTGIEMPIVAGVHAVLFENCPPDLALANLMLREPKPEFWQ